MALPVLNEIARIPNAKGPLDKEPFAFNFSEWLSLIAGDVLVLTTSVPVTVVRSDGQPNDMTVETAVVNNSNTRFGSKVYRAQTLAIVWLSGGTIGVDYTLTVTVTATPSGRIGGRSMIIPLSMR